MGIVLQSSGSDSKASLGQNLHSTTNKQSDFEQAVMVK